VESLSQNQEGAASGEKATVEEFLHLPTDIVLKLHKYAVFS